MQRAEFKASLVYEIQDSLRKVERTYLETNKQKCLLNKCGNMSLNAKKLYKAGELVYDSRIPTVR